MMVTTSMPFWLTLGRGDYSLILQVAGYRF